MKEPVYPGLQKIIDHLKRLDEVSPECSFNMNSTHYDCGSACCIGGHAALMLQKHQLIVEEALALLCDVPLEITTDLCWPMGPVKSSFTGGLNYKSIQLEEAITVLEHCRDTGKVDWLPVFNRQSEDGVSADTD